MRSELRALLSSRSWEYFIITIILINAVTLGLEAELGLLSEFSTALLFVDRLILGVFVVELAARLTAEGVEEDQQRDALVQFGCDHLQDFLLSRPLEGGQLAQALLNVRRAA
ncbi:hypothetical protein [Devosia sp. RR2S18]|uniref:hypothetical protein n=1 Tax=Devosia rhizosphaerae TaxID=3049774 RepID=UPI0025416292|nr:hypothetical protein [Devosia sp. RR2S18]WIJ24715.1 hypothetical protein QOV41_17145 [Devosia sp. RR2S18]